MPDPNPYASESNAPLCETRGSGRSWFAMFLLCVGLLSFASAGYYLYAGYRLRLEYPDLVDSSPEVDFYWPAVAELINHIVAGVSGVVGMLSFAGAMWALLHRKPSQEWDRA